MKQCLCSVLVAAPLFFVPAITFAATTLKSLVSEKVVPLLNAAIGLIMVLAVLTFMAGIIRFMATAGDDKSRAYGKNMMVWGLTVLLVMVSVWGIVKIIHTTLFG